LLCVELDTFYPSRETFTLLREEKIPTLVTLGCAHTGTKRHEVIYHFLQMIPSPTIIGQRVSSVSS